MFASRCFLSGRVHPSCTRRGISDACPNRVAIVESRARSAFSFDPQSYFGRLWSQTAAIVIKRHYQFDKDFSVGYVFEALHQSRLVPPRQGFAYVVRCAGIDGIPPERGLNFSRKAKSEDVVRLRQA